jgi:hypothetical protein
MARRQIGQEQLIIDDGHASGRSSLAVCGKTRGLRDVPLIVGHRGCLMQ